jgi:type VI secretion system protein ImpL
MRRIYYALRSTIMVIVLVAVLLAFTIWFIGPVVAVADFRPFEDPTIRAVTIGGLVLLVIITILVVLLRRRSRDRAMTEEITRAAESPEDAADAAVRSELGDLNKRMKEALSLLRRSKLGGRSGSRYLYQLPWYIIIGPPGAGKTTAIVNSGLKFPLADRMGLKPVGGVGGTRNCDWWFTNEAVLIDTAGRYTTQDSDQTADAKAWDGFLSILKKYRPRQPVNGALVAISLSDLSLLDEPSRRAHATAIRKRLGELRERLGVRFPVYVLFTKADLIAGFQEFFETLGRDGREQVWGFTLPLPKKGEDANPLARFGVEFDALLQALNNQSLERMQQETDAQRRSLIHGFPQQLASLREVAETFLSDIFEESRYEERQLMRGVYFTSGTQEGTPIDRLMMGMARTFGIGRQAIGSGQGQGRSYFLTRLMQGVIFREAGIVSADDRVERRYRWAIRGGIAAAALIAVGFGVVWSVSYLGNRALVANAAQQVAGYRALIAGIGVNPVADTDLPKIVPPLNILRDLPGNPAATDPDPPTELTWGLWQGDSIGSEAAQTYRGALNQLLLPRLLLRLEEQMAANLNNSDLLYEALKIYLMLGLQGPMDEELVRQWLTLDWSLAYPGDANAQLRADLAAHLDRLLGEPMKAIALNGPLVDQVQGILSETPLSERIYRGIVQSPQAKELADWRVIEAGGPATARVLVRPSGDPLSDGVDGIYTYRGFHEVFLPEALDVARRITRESWVLGPRGAALTNDQNLANIARDVLDLYYNDYVLRWERVLGDLDVVPMQNMNQAVDVINVLSGPTSPIVNILKSADRETRLAEISGPVDVDAAKAGATETIVSEVVEGQSARVQGLLAVLKAATPSLSGQEEVVAKPGQYVQDRFQWLHDLVKEEPGKPSQLQGVIDTMTEVYQELNRLAIGGGTPLVAAPGQGGATDRLAEATGRLPDPVKRWASQVASSGSEVVTGGLRTQLNSIWQAKVLQVCKKAIADRYPFSKSSEADVGLQDFARLFAPNGLIDQFFNDNLLQHVDTGSNPWTWRRTAGKDLGMSDSVLRQFQLAAEIRDSFFLAPGMPSVTFDVTPAFLDPNAQKSVLELDGQIVEFANGPQETTPMQWPGKAGGRNRVALVPEIAGTENQISRQGPWALFRLFNSASLGPLVDGRFKVTFSVGGRLVGYEIRPGSAFNPFNLPALSSFRCLESL